LVDDRTPTKNNALLNSRVRQSAIEKRAPIGRYPRSLKLIVKRHRPEFASRRIFASNAVQVNTARLA
jgi:hypothetical protein